MQSDLPICRRRSFSPEFKFGLVMQCQPGVSVSAVALANGINANQLRRWIREHAARGALQVAPSRPALVPIEVNASPSLGQSIEVNLEKGSARVNIRWPADCAESCALWLCSWLK